MTITFTKVEQDETGSAARGIYRYNKTTDTYTLVTDSTSMDYFDDSAVAGDALIFRGRYSERASARFIFNVGTALSGTDVVLKWYVGGVVDKNSGAYASITWIDISSLIVDNTNGFTTTGINEVELNAQYERVLGYFSPITTNARDFWFKCEIDSLTSITEGGAQQTDRVKFGYNLCTITGSYLEGTITNATNGYRIYDSTTSPFTSECIERSVWLPDSDSNWNKFGVGDAPSSTQIYLGTPKTLGSSTLAYYDLDNPPVAGDSYAVSYIMEDLKDACESAGYDWIKGQSWQPRRRLHKQYEINCEIYINNASSSGYTFFSGFSTRYAFYGNYCFKINSSYINNNQMMLGTRMYGYTLNGSQYAPLDSIPAYGCSVDVMTGGVNGATFTIAGEFSGTTFTSETRYLFVTYFQIVYANIYNCIFENCQLSNGANSNGLQLTHCPVAEPLRNPSSSFNIAQFRAGGPCIYCTSSGNFTLDSPASSDSRPFRTYSGFQAGSNCKVIDKDENTKYDLNWGAFVDPTGTFDFWVRTMFTILESTDKTPIEDVSIKIYDNTNTLVVDETTDSNGQVGQDGTVMVMEKTAIHDSSSSATSDSIFTSFNPFRIIISKQGYETIDFEMDLVKKEILTFELKKAIPALVSADGRVAIKQDPTNSKASRGGVIIL